ncbi:serine/threonine phosphatase stp [Geobacter sp. OR-1]|uniref:Stp1/IreP family PP2C-type Ser/Thr phosphatase n=1 Tax=Geobacter sp. OR-1 TaxID=1266765 RepID=UPI000541ACBD|nr:Stp1/IreP family PP2C-type Ser/Thr phosphatase [Geobacter sp. OR-1]GAM09394.1 serine/threonine phosphatase stp [Geobacter sp. OR-1]
MARLLAAGATDVGTRQNNEDAFLVRPEIGLFALADGMGGAASGEIASSCFIETATEIFARTPQPTEETLVAMVYEAFREANARILEYVAKHPKDHGMGCTGELLAFHNDHYIIGHVGDSRVYLFRDGMLRQITKDHSLVQSQLDNGVISVEEARNHPRRNIILRAVGTDPALQLDVIKGTGRDMDTFLICSDGLSDAIGDREISAILASGAPLDRSAQTLIQSALAAGGNDNITVILCELQNHEL